ncbi:hypothetical protein ACVIW2_001226 [Bradyrhizobium huanghuaihaiense]|uniref:Lipoprotein n=1 Tax=Bradyrhizobium huanghuaihaiense TaxID=990078 RepID=A0A562RHX1_9BRAD|nr:hypothetical protein IQ16_03872 [Bradyrhizobium huanghuaihaiense]
MQTIVRIGSRTFAALSLVSLLGGCGVAAKIEARNDYRTSADQYKACLTANPAAPQNCEGLRLAMETDERKFNNLSAGTNPGSQISHNVTILNR